MAVPSKFALPFAVTPGGGPFATVEQDSVDDVVQCVTVILGTPKGTRWDLPDLGIDDPVFQSSLDEVGIVGQLARYEPRARVTASGVIDDHLTEAVLVKVSQLHTPLALDTPL